ncbi:DUF2194 domain-containing protein [candidate division KSB1 bacterium]|nr:DUF2194 domain-containing protein [candidate division KSB1 bacterium]
MKTKLLLISFFILTCLNSDLNGEVISRKILALYDSQRGQTARKNHIHANAEVVLNHLGSIVEYWDIAKGLPGEKRMKKYCGVITWFYNDSMNRPQAYLQWATKQVDAGRKFVILDNLSAFRDAATGEFLKISAVNRFCKSLGFIIDDTNWTSNIAKIELVNKVPEMVEFERSLDYELTNYEVYKPLHPKTKVYLKLKRNDIRDSESALVFTTPHGGFAAAGYVFYENPANYQKHWRINPFKFFEEAFGLKGQPRPDVTTLNGLRVWSSHIDGDALISRSQVKPNTYCGEVIRDEILNKYKWPVSVSVVVSEVETDSKFENIARSIYQLDWVEAASHSYSHPFYWSDDFEDKDKYERKHLPIEGYKFNFRDEIIGSVNYINKKLLPENKKVKQFFWTGNCEPTKEALKLCRQIRINNINGGDTVFDKTHPSYTYVAPLSVTIGGYRQIYSPNSNENIYTNQWEGPYFGFKSVLQTFKNTESPLRIRPIDIYYHFYIGERWASLNTLKDVLTKTMKTDVAPMFLSEYTEMVHGFFSARMEKVSMKSWRIRNYGDCTTIRFDDSQAFLDLDKSVNVIGFNHYQGSLYIHLENAKEAVIVLTDSKPESTFLAQSSHRLFDWQASKESVFFRTTGFGKGQFMIANLLENAAYQVTIGSLTETNRSDAEGTLTLMHPMEGPVQVKIDLAKQL